MFCDAVTGPKLMIIPETLLDGLVPVLQAPRTHHFNIAGVFTTMTPEKSYPLITNFFAICSFITIKFL